MSKSDFFMKDPTGRDAKIQSIVDSNFDLYKRITDDPTFGALIKKLMFDQYLRTRRDADAPREHGEG